MLAYCMLIYLAHESLKTLMKRGRGLKSLENLSKTDNGSNQEKVKRAD